jgi:uncharacterized protein YbjQ (UPF0145 family)
LAEVAELKVIQTMSIEFCCPSCLSMIPAEDEEVGLSVECLGCGARIIVPDGSSSSGPLISEVGRIRPDQIPVTSSDIDGTCRILAPVNFVIGSRGGMRDEFESLKSRQRHVIEEARRLGQLSTSHGLGQSIVALGVAADGEMSMGVHHAGSSFVSSDLELAFMIAVSQIQLRASYLGANAVVGFRWDVDVDSNSNVLNFLGTAYGTAVLVQ